MKNNSSSRKYGVFGPYEIRLRVPCTFSVSASAWPIVIPYAITPLSALNQCQHEAYVDVVGRVTSKEQKPQGSGGLQKTILLLVDETHEQELELLGSQHSISATVGDVVAVKGARVVEWKMTRTLQTGFMTIVEVNPVPRQGLQKMQPVEAMSPEPRKKAIRMTCQTPFSIADAKKLMEQMLQDAETNADVPTKEVVLRGTFAAFTESFFVDDAPITDSTRASIRLRTVLRNAHQELSVVLWGRAATAILNMSSDELLPLWETGNEDASKQGELLTSLSTPCTLFSAAAWLQSSDRLDIFRAPGGDLSTRVALRG